MAVINSNSKFLLFAQHGWADTGNDIGKLAHMVANSQGKITAPSLGFIQTFIRIEPLVERLEQIATEVIANHPDFPIRIIGHSMGGLIWLEALNRNPQWWEKVHSLILLASPIGGSGVARLIDPLGFGIGTAKDLGKNRREIAKKIAQKIPTLSVASDLKLGSDGLVTVENTKFVYANWLLVSGIPHDAMKCHADLVPIIQNFWSNPRLGLPPQEDFVSDCIQRLRSVPGMTDTDYRNFERSQIVANLPDEITIHIWNSPWGINHVFLGKERKHCLYAGYVGLIHVLGLRQAIAEIKKYPS